MSKKIAIIFFAVIVILLGLVVWFLVQLVGSKETSTLNSPSPYSAVYLSSGDIYFGKLSWFPKPKMTSVWFIQKSLDNQNQPQLNLLPFSSVSWGPTDEIFLNSKEIIFWTKLRNDSQIVKVITQSAVGQLPQNSLPPDPSSEKSQSASPDKTKN